MTTTTSTVEVTDVAPWLYPGHYVEVEDRPVITVTGPVNGVWTITAPDTVSQADLDAAVKLQVDSLSAHSNHDTLVAKAQNAQTNNATFLALAAPTNAQTLAQVKALTRQVNALIKLQIQDLSSLDGT